MPCLACPQCPPCRNFTPLLADFYREAQALEKGGLEIVFVTSDQSKEDFRSYFIKEMPWVAVPFEEDDVRDALSQAFRVRGIPALLIVDPATGAVIDSDARLTVMRESRNVRNALSLWRSA
eukprot:scaffold30_cov166-Ochromonas_danica.AAC.4